MNLVTDNEQRAEVLCKLVKVAVSIGDRDAYEELAQETEAAARDPGLPHR